MSHNQQLDGLLAQVQETAESARKEEDFKPIFPLLRNFQQTAGPIKYDNSAKWYAALAVATLGGIFAMFYFMNLEFQQYLGDAGYVVLGVFVAVLIGILVAIGTANSGIDAVSDTIFRYDVYFDNKLSGVNIEGKKSGLYQQFREEFGDFRSRGDEDRYISSMTRGAYSGKEHFFEYDYYVFHYVEVWYETVNHYDSKGKFTHSTLEKRTRTCYRRGLILDFPFIKGLAVVSSGGAYPYAEEFKPTSGDFKFSVDADSEHEAAKFLKPAVVLAFVELDKHFSGLNLEVNRAGRMNIAFSDSDVLDLERKFSIAQPDEFEAEIASHLDLPKLRLLLEFVGTLKKHNDSNF